MGQTGLAGMGCRVDCRRISSCLGGKDVWEWYDQNLFVISLLAALISLLAIGLVFRKAAAHD